MNKYLAIRHFIFTIAFISCAITAKASHASETLYLELGKPASIEETEASWRDMSEKYNSLLGKLKFYPKKVILDGEAKSIIQAGPVAEKRRAQRICSILFGKDIPCFVIEGIEKAPPTISVVMSQALNQNANTSFVIPQEDLSRDIGAAQEIKAVPENPQVAESTSLLDDAIEIIDGENGQEIVAPAREGEVDVAQAIPVPLSDLSNENRVDVLPQVQQTPKEAPATNEASLVYFSSENSGNLIINSFKNEADANSFWSHASDKRPDLVDGLRARIQRPLLASSVGKIQMSIGVFANGGSAADFCNNTVFYYDSALKCSYEVTNAQFAGAARNVTSTTSSEISVNDVPSSPTSSRADSYEERRRSLVRRVPAGQAELANQVSEMSDAESTLKYWVQVVIADSKAEAAKRLEEIKSENSDLDVGVGSMILASPSSHGKFTARIGAFSDENEANKLCDNLQLRGIDCLLITTK